MSDIARIGDYYTPETFERIKTLTDTLETPFVVVDLEIGDRLYWFSTGAYTTSYSAIEFNGFPPLKSYYI